MIDRVVGNFWKISGSLRPSEVAVNNNNSYKLLGRGGIINIDFVDSRTSYTS